MRRLAGLLLCVVSPTVLAAPARRYNDPAVPPERSALIARLEGVVAQVASAERREVPVPEPRLEWVAQEIARRVPSNGPPSNEVVQSALWLHGIVEPAPHLIIVTMGEGGDEALIAELRTQLPRALRQGRYRRVGAAVAGQGSEWHVVVAMQESFLELEPVPRALEGGGPFLLRGRLREPFVRPEGFVTAPDGKVEHLEVTGDATRFDARFHCGPTRGRYQVELTGEDRFGSSVLANFPIYCGMPPPAALVSAAATPAEESFADAASAEAQLARLVNADWARAGLPALELDTRLSAVARAHSADMQAHGFVGHVSPSTGSAADRLRKAGLPTLLVLENVARAYTPGEAERGLMDSPGHRANLLNREVTRLGIGVALKEGVGARELLVTQVMTRPPDPFDAHTSTDLRRRIEELRRARSLPPLASDRALDEVAQSTARALASGALTRERAGEPVERAVGAMSDRYRAVRSVVAVLGQVAQVDSLASALSDTTITTLGIGVAPSLSKERAGALHVVLVLCTRR